MPPIFAAQIQDIAPFLPWVGLVIAVLALTGSLKACHRRRLLDNLPTSKTQGVFIGLVELKGTPQCAQPLMSYLAEMPCVYYAYTIEEQWSRMITTTESDGKGGTQTVTRQESGWTTVDSRTEMTSFYLQDDTGLLLIQPEGARIEALNVFGETCTPFNPLYYGKGPSGGVIDSDQIRRFGETAIPLSSPLFIVGQARERADIVAPEIAADPATSEYLISVRSQEEISHGLGWRIGLFFGLGLLAAPGGHLLGDLAANQPSTALSFIIYAGEVLLYLGVGAMAWTFTVYNSLVELRQRVAQGWGQVDIQLKRRHDLIPNLVDVVQGYRDHEAVAQQALGAMRSQLDATTPGQPGAEFQAVSGPVQVLREAYPELKANESFLALQKSLVETEQRIALARAYFNSIATFYNTRLEVVPDRFIAAFAGMKPRALMEANDFERAPVEVAFAAPVATVSSETLPPVPTP